MASASFAPFKSRNFTSMWIGALLSNVGTWMEAVGLGYYVAHTTGKAVVVCTRRCCRVPSQRRARADRLGNGRSMEQAPDPVDRQRPVGGRRRDPRGMGRRRNRDSARHRCAQLRGRLHRRVHVSIVPIDLAGPRAARAPRRRSRTVERAMEPWQDHRAIAGGASRSPSGESVPRCGATRSASSP